MDKLIDTLDRRTAADLVFERLHDDIVSLKCLPGTKLSEAEVAERFGVSRQPVRDAFNRLERMNLLLIRPQRATRVRGFSMALIGHARFVRLAVELEVVRSACAIWDAERADILQGNLDAQGEAIAAGRNDSFHDLDYQFHKHICGLSGHPLAFETIRDCKREIDRLCVLSLGRANETALLRDDHAEITLSLARGDADRASDVTRRHLARLESTIEEIRRTHGEYFED